MTTLETFGVEDIYAIVRTDLGVDVPAGTDAGTPFTDLGIDSLGRLELLTVLETRFSITIPDGAAGELLSPRHTLDYLERRLPKPEHARTDNEVVIAAPLDLVWAVTNDVSRWPGLFSEYASAEILDQTATVVRFRLTTHPDESGQAWSWVSERIIDPSTYSVSARRIETGPFEYMNITWTYHRHGSNGTRMRWVQEFHMKNTAPLDDAGMAKYINSNTPIQMALIKEQLERLACPVAA
jgi:aromatase